MNLQKLLKNPEACKDMLESAQQLGTRRSQLSEQRYALKKLQIKENTSLLLVLPVELAVPFNIFDLDDPTYNSRNPLALLGSPTTWLKVLKEEAKKNPALANRMVKDLGVSGVDALRLDAGLSLEDVKTYAKYRRLLVYTDDIQHMNMDSKSKFGTNRHVTVYYDENGDIQNSFRDPGDGTLKQCSFGVQLYQLESALIAAKVGTIRESYEPGGENSHRTATDMQAEIKALYQSRLISNPYVAGFTRAVVFELDTQKLINAEAKDKWLSSKDPRKFEYYIKVNSTTMSKYESILGSRFDKNFDFLEVTWRIPEKKSDQNVALQMDINEAGSDVCLAAEGNNIREFSDKYREFRDNLDVWKLEIMKHSVWDMHSITDTELASQFRDNIKQYNDVMNNKEILERYGETLSAVDETLSNSIIASIMDGNESKISIDAKDIAAIPKMTQELEDTDEFTQELADALGEIGSPEESDSTPTGSEDPMDANVSGVSKVDQALS